MRKVYNSIMEINKKKMKENGKSYTINNTERKSKGEAQKIKIQSKKRTIFLHVLNGISYSN